VDRPLRSLVFGVLSASVANPMLLVWGTFALGLIGIAQAAEPIADCEHSPLRVNECLNVRGRLSVYNGFLNYRIWPIGTHRLLAAVGGDGSCCEDKSILPLDINKLLSVAPFRTQIFANWRVCPLTRQKPGVMQHVCVQRAEHLTVRRVPDRTAAP
jgi:hypothetical protein